MQKIINDPTFVARIGENPEKWKSADFKEGRESSEEKTWKRLL